jgi:S1-C subfamily serine protease
METFRPPAAFPCYMDSVVTVAREAEKLVQFTMQDGTRRSVHAAGLWTLPAVFLCLGLGGCSRPAKPIPAAAPVAAASAAQPASLHATKPETRSLLPEIDEARFGAAAQVKTRFGKGTGLVLPEQHEVLAHLHVVMAPDKAVAQTISVNLSLAPREYQKDLHAFVVARDPTHDLVLLKVGAEPAPGQAAAATEDSPKKAGRRRHGHRRNRRPAHATDASDPMLNTQTHRVKTRVVYDGPDRPDDLDSQGGSQHR